MKHYFEHEGAMFAIAIGVAQQSLHAQTIERKRPDPTTQVVVYNGSAVADKRLGLSVKQGDKVEYTIRYTLQDQLYDELHGTYVYHVLEDIGWDWKDVIDTLTWETKEEVYKWLNKDAFGFIMRFKPTHYPDTAKLLYKRYPLANRLSKGIYPIHSPSYEDYCRLLVDAVMSFVANDFLSRAKNAIDRFYKD